MMDGAIGIKQASQEKQDIVLWSNKEIGQNINFSCSWLWMAPSKSLKWTDTKRLRVMELIITTKTDI